MHQEKSNLLIHFNQIDCIIVEPNKSVSKHFISNVSKKYQNMSVDKHWFHSPLR